MTDKPRIWISNREPAAGEVVTVRAMVTHPMETGMRRNALSETIPRNIIDRFDCTLNDETLVSWRPDTAVSPNPYLQFRFRAQESGELRMVWVDDRDMRIEAVERIEVG